MFYCPATSSTTHSKYKNGTPKLSAPSDGADDQITLKSILSYTQESSERGLARMYVNAYARVNNAQRVITQGIK